MRRGCRQVARPLAVVVALSSALGAAADPAPLPWGSEANAEAVPEGLQLNGLPVEAWRIEAADPAALARSVAERWRREGSVVRSSRHEGREVVARIAGDMSEALQWRPGERDALFSRLVLQPQLGQPPIPLLPPPRGCRVLSTVQAGSRDGFLQLGGRCELPVTAVVARLRAAAQAAGFTEVALPLPGGLAFARGPTRVQWLFRSNARGDAATFVLLQPGAVP